MIPDTIGKSAQAETVNQRRCLARLPARPRRLPIAPASLTPSHLPPLLLLLKHRPNKHARPPAPTLLGKKLDAPFFARLVPDADDFDRIRIVFLHVRQAGGARGASEEEEAALALSLSLAGASASAEALALAVVVGWARWW